MKKVERFIRGDFVKHYGTEDYVLINDNYVEKNKETRGVWFSTVANIDIEEIKDVNEGKAYLLHVIDVLKEYHINTVVFQVRPTNDALYSSKINPWSRYLTGEEDKYPGFDVFGFFVTECEKVGIEIHAWINPYRIGKVKLSDVNMAKDEYLDTLSERNFARLHKDVVIEAGDTRLVLDPSSDLVQQFIVDTCVEIAHNYHIKAIHIDDYFYPYENIKDPNEEAKRDLVDKNMSISDFRRHNVNCLIKKMSNALKLLGVEFGISPFGIYRTNSKEFEKVGKVGGWDKGSNNCYDCFQCYDGLFADVFLWMKEGWIDYVVPQVYFEFDNYVTRDNGEICERVHYADLVDWWCWACKETNVKLYVGQGLYRYKDEGNWSNSEEIINQLKYNQDKKEVDGTIFFTYRDLERNNCEALNEARKKLKLLWTKDVKPV